MQQFNLRERDGGRVEESRKVARVAALGPRRLEARPIRISTGTGDLYLQHPTDNGHQLSVYCLFWCPYITFLAYVALDPVTKGTHSTY